MLIRYHWGLAAGHVYTHSHQNSPNAPYAYFPNEETNILEGGSTYRLEPGIQSEEATTDGVSEGGLGGREAEDLLDASEEEDETDSEMWAVHLCLLEAICPSEWSQKLAGVRP